MKEIEKFDPSTLMQGVKDRIKSTFVSLIPDDKWEEMVKSEIDKYFTQKTDHYYNQRRNTSDFEDMVKEVIDKECRERMAKLLASEVFAEKWEANGKRVASETIQKLLIENSGQILAGMMASAFSQAIMLTQSNLQQNKY